ncbi:MAG: GDSL-type esterase/lipase family protein [Cytophagaceae bacterium]|nr:GDSL-type esterase/lipase family protein [Cytophagaceae bacterium]
MPDKFTRMLYLFLSFGLVLVVLLGFLLWGEARLYRPDARYPTRMPLQAGKTCLVCAGDSLTHGNISANYVEIVAGNFPDWQVFNAGINSDLSETLLARLPDVIAVKPDVVTVLIGTNDVNATLSKAALLSYHRHGKTTGQPDAERFRRNLTEIVRRLKTETSARIALLSLPPMSEDLTHEANRRADFYSKIIRETAETEGVTYLPLRERMKTELHTQPSQPTIRFERTVLTVFLAGIQRHVLGWSYGRIADYNGNRLLTDNLHLNSAGAVMVAELVEEFVFAKI